MTSRLPDDHGMEQLVRGWLRDDDSPPMDRNRRIGRIMGRVDETRQRRTLWPLIPFGRRAMHSASDAEGAARGPGPAPATVTARLAPLPVAAVLTLFLLAGSLLVYLVAQTPAPLPVPGSAAATSLDELAGMARQAWAGEIALDQVYAPDAVHSATFYDRTTEYVGPDEIAQVAQGEPDAIGPRIVLQDEGSDWRWVSFISLGGGSACLWHAVDGFITRQDCMVPEQGYQMRPAAAVTDDPGTLAAIEELSARLRAAWSRDTSLETLESVYTPDAVHTARYLDDTATYSGPAQILSVARLGGTIEPVGDIVAFTAPEGELAFAEAGRVGGSPDVCLFRARDGLVFRHDCLLSVDR